MWPVGAGILLGALVCASGCRPIKPMIPRPEEQGQKTVDDAWEKALSPVNRLSHQELLDVLLATQAFYLGMDRVSWRGEKRFSGGLVVTEILYDRTKPEEDRFEFNVYDLAQKRIRHERYTREQIDQTFRELFDPQPEKPGVTQRKQEQAKRLAAAIQLFPTIDEIRRGGRNDP
jgi:hypothetical protein